MTEAEKTIGRTLAEAVSRIPTVEGQRYFLGFVEGAAAMAEELCTFFFTDDSVETVRR